MLFPSRLYADMGSRRCATMAITKSGKAKAQPEELTHYPTALRGVLSEGVVLVDSEKGTALVTPAAERILGLPPGAGWKAPLDALPRALVRITTEVAASQKGAHRQELELALDNHSRKVGVMAVALGTRVGHPQGVMLVLNEDSGAPNFEEQVERLNRLASLGTLAASMAHEIKNALVAGKTFIDLLLESQGEAELVQVVKRELGRIDTLVSRMLKFARPGEATFHQVHLHEVLDHSLHLVAPLMEAKSVTHAASLSAPTDLLEGDEHELQQAFVNLLLNAIEAVGAHGAITVATSRELSEASSQRPGQPELRVSIQDTGTGIAPEHMKRLFEPFFTTKPSGTGLGLAITRRILQQHHGEIRAQSKLGEGTTFLIRLPALVNAST